MKVPFTLLFTAIIAITSYTFSDKGLIKRKQMVQSLLVLAMLLRCIPNVMLNAVCGAIKILTEAANTNRLSGWEFFIT
jgi:hypothetical protein